VIIKQIIQAFTALRERFATLSKEFEKANAKIEEQQTRLDEKDHTIALYQKIIFGPKTERYVNEQVNPGQPTLFSTAEPGGQTPQESDEKETITYERKKPKKQRDKGTGRAPLAGHLARIDIVIEPEEDTGGMVKIGEEITEVLDIIPPKFQVFRIIRPKYARPGSRTKDIENPIIVADMPGFSYCQQICLPPSLPPPDSNVPTYWRRDKVQHHQWLDRKGVRVVKTFVRRILQTAFLC